MKPRRFFAKATLAATLALGGCDLAPVYDPPTIHTPSHYKNGVASDDAALAAPPPQAWWRHFNEPALIRLEEQAAADNPDLAAALARYERAGALVGQAESGLFPHADWDGALSANKQSAHRPLRSANQPNYYGNNAWFGEVSYEIDLWGRVRDVVAAARAGQMADMDLLAGVKLALQGDVARNYIFLKGLDAEAALLRSTRKVYNEALALTRARVEGKIAPPIDVERAETQLRNVEAQADDLARRRALVEDALASLVGQSASGFKMKVGGGLPATPRPPRVAPSDLLRRRPDVAMRERLLFAANEKIGAARAAFLPKFSISLTGGLQDTQVNLASLKNSVWSIGPQASLPVFDAGMRLAELEAAKQTYSEAAANYRASVLAALQDVEDCLASRHWLLRELQARKAAAIAARNAEGMALNLYQEGAASYLDVVSAQNAALDAERAEIAVHTQLLQTDIALMLAFGGGWTAPGVAAAIVGQTQ